MSREAGQPVMLNTAMTLSGRSRTTSSPGTPLRRQLLRAVLSHVPPADRGRRAHQVRGLLGQLGATLDLDEPVWRLLEIHAQGHPRVARERPPLRGVLAGVEDDAVVLDDEPDRRHEGPAVRARPRELAGSGAGGEERADLGVSYRCHALTLREPRITVPIGRTRLRK